MVDRQKLVASCGAYALAALEPPDPQSLLCRVRLKARGARQHAPARRGG